MFLVTKYVRRRNREAIVKINLLVHLHDIHLVVKVYVLDDTQLYMPLLLGLDFLCGGQVTLKSYLGKYILQGGKEYKFIQKTGSSLQWGEQVSQVNFFMHSRSRYLSKLHAHFRMYSLKL